MRKIRTYLSEQVPALGLDGRIRRAGGYAAVAASLGASRRDLFLATQRFGRAGLRARAEAILPSSGTWPRYVGLVANASQLVPFLVTPIVWGTLQVGLRWRSWRGVVILASAYAAAFAAAQAYLLSGGTELGAALRFEVREGLLLTVASVLPVGCLLGIAMRSPRRLWPLAGVAAALFVLAPGFLLNASHDATAEADHVQAAYEGYVAQMAAMRAKAAADSSYDKVPDILEAMRTLGHGVGYTQASWASVDAFRARWDATKACGKDQDCLDRLREDTIPLAWDRKAALMRVVGLRRS